MIKRTIIILIAILLVGCHSNLGTKNVDRSDFLLDTYVDISLFGVKNEEVLDEMYEEVVRLESILSLYKEDSDLYQLRYAKGQLIKVNEETLEIIDKSLDYTKLTGGLFDVTSGPLIDLWGITSDTPMVPTQEEIKTALLKVGEGNLSIKEDQVILRNGAYINLGAIAKGYITDRIVEQAKAHEVAGGIFNFGGNIYVLGNKPDGSNYNVGIQRPGDDRNDYFAIFHGTDKSIVTSGTYERYFEYENERYHHILNPKTGYPSDTDLVSVTIISDTCFEGDALSTSALLLGLEDAQSLISSLEGVEAIFVTGDNEVYITENLMPHVTIIDEDISVEIIS